MGGVFQSSGGSSASSALTKHFQEFLASGTFVPSAGLIAAGGFVELEMAGGFGGGGGSNAGNQYGGGNGGSGGQSYLHTFDIVNSPVLVTIGAGGIGSSNTGGTGGNTAFGTKIAYGGKGGQKYLSRAGPYSSSYMVWSCNGIDGGGGSKGATGGGGQAGTTGKNGYCLVTWWE